MAFGCDRASREVVRLVVDHGGGPAGDGAGSHQAGSRSQPGTVQPWSRVSMAPGSGGSDAAGAADVEVFGGGAEDDRDDRGVAGERRAVAPARSAWLVNGTRTASAALSASIAGWSNPVLVAHMEPT